MYTDKFILMITYCKHCLNTCKTPDVKKDCPKYLVETVENLHAEKRKMNKLAIDKLDYIDYGIRKKEN